MPCWVGGMVPSASRWLSSGFQRLLPAGICLCSTRQRTQLQQGWAGGEASLGSGCWGHSKEGLSPANPLLLSLLTQVSPAAPASLRRS